MEKGPCSIGHEMRCQIDRINPDVTIEEKPIKQDLRPALKEVLLRACRCTAKARHSQAKEQAQEQAQDKGDDP